MGTQKKYNVRLNNLEKVEQLLQETYDQARGQIIEIENEMNKIRNSTTLKDTTIEEKAKFSKAMSDFFKNKESAIKLKFDIAKFMGEIIKYGGDASKAIENSESIKNSALSINDIRQAIKSTMNEDNSPSKYELKNHKTPDKK